MISTDNRINGCDNWIDLVRVQMYEDMQRLGKDEFYRRMDEDMRELTKQYGFKIVKDIGGE
ncbi:hypothetical protein FACS1894167_12020 [Synergistales bacterium]|nr:hypothetical protein FACS1894167_12020 [Synergistales bacterium]